MNKKEVKLVLKNLDLSPKKSLGQNFLTDERTLSKIIQFSDISRKDIILEIGSGLGALTKKLIENANKVYAYEIDKKLYQHLMKKFSHISNLKLINQDILEESLPDHNKVVSNIPYSITGPILEKVFFKSNPPEGNLLIEKTIADRVFYKDKYHNFSRITVTVNSFMESTERIQISKNSFYPSPKINLSLIKLKPRQKIHPFLLHQKTRQFFLKFIAGIMPYKNKNIANAIKLFLKEENITAIDKDKVINKLKENNYKNQKVSQFAIDNFASIAEKIYRMINMEADSP
ncbi:MAG: 16S rRNA (adenine(1518)-N(6)/adenine(1519)-N(6))-dimethyltransferase RsmA [Promethearchaeati archaeon]